MTNEDLIQYLDYFILELKKTILIAEGEHLVLLKDILERFYLDDIIEDAKKIITVSYTIEYSNYIYERSQTLKLKMLKPTDDVWKIEYRKLKINSII